MSVDLHKTLDKLTSFFSAKPNDLFYIRSQLGILIFSRHSLLHKWNFARDLINTLIGIENFCEFDKLPESSFLYQENKKLFKNEHACFIKYVNRLNAVVLQTIISQDCFRRLYIESRFLGNENYTQTNGIVFQNQPKRKIIKGILVSDYLKNKTSEEQKDIIRPCIDYIFKEYTLPENENYLSGEVLDAHFRNILYTNGKFFFFDHDHIYAKPISKSAYLYFLLKGDNHPLYAYFCQIFNIKESEEEYASIWLQGNDLQKAAVSNKSLIEKYCGIVGIKS